VKYSLERKDNGYVLDLLSEDEETLPTGFVYEDDERFKADTFSYIFDNDPKIMSFARALLTICSEEICARDTDKLQFKISVTNRETGKEIDIDTGEELKDCE